MGLWECGQSRPGPRHGRKRRKGLSTFPRPNPKKKLFIKSPAGLLRNGKRRTGTGRRQRRVWEAWSIRAPNAKPERSANKDCPQAFHALRAAANEKRANDPKRQKSGTMSGFIIGSGRIGPGAAPKMQNPHEPSMTRSRRDSTRILTSARYSCL